MAPPLLRLLETILIDCGDEHNSREVITMAQSMGLFHTMAEAMGLHAFGTVDDDFLLSFYPANRPLCNYAITKLIYPEVIDSNSRFETSHITSTIPSKWAGTTWDYTAKMIIHNLDQMGIDWASVECFQSEGERAGVRCTEITVVITAYSLPMVNWAFLKSIQEIHAMMGARVEIRVGKLERHDGVVSDSFTDQTFLPPGSNVSFHYIMGEYTGGTVGGIIELVDGDGTCQKLCALTCHSYLPMSGSSLKIDVGAASDFTRISVAQYETLACSYPNCHSWFEQLRDAFRDLKWLRTEIEQIKSDWNPDWEPNVMADQRAYLQSKKDEERKRKQIISDDSLAIGTVCASSGSRVSLNHHLDWALVTLDKGRARSDNTNMIRESLSFSQIKMPLTSTETLKPGSVVYKAKYPDLTNGHVSYTKSYVRYHTEQNGRIIVAPEWALIPSRTHKQFSEPKDCGAWVVDRVDNTVVGVIYAMNTATGVAYITPIQEIFDDIEKDTGFTVRLPKGLDAS
ncbi:hypothetical protein TMatcc_008520 [Talaromyces marneffei ATCC 18224]|uniref:Uncharacterized protein n=1 Tax=Talaromyces marneffei (strain ATCC 18224 / CBS 334.59 / QM 7333) TaxID=441960 RepID=B6QLS9_TALMQ|nr:uncharacterized protein EYB26_007852 [Talaromyces marneffei]EEA22056.1 conserved hypothetical protein [Talaromyces marneffei ATCC 18224]KAE8550483.1 hypothetical protein EYB25_006710 [Talaromyces marneffei]QGA20151.1 hypothetical protein EYB26_007852 [Talaromyces marneffei]